jgi:hypothetical protein
MPAVSPSPTAITSVMSSSSTVTVTVTSPPNPCAVPVNVLVSPASPPVGSSLEQPTKLNNARAKTKSKDNFFHVFLHNFLCCF